MRLRTTDASLPEVPGGSLSHPEDARVSAQPPDLPSDSAPPPLTARPYILVAEDSEDMRALLTEILESEGYEVRAVPSGGSAFSEMTQRRPDLLITDLFMPGMNGFSLRSQMLGRPELADVPVIVLSAYWHRPGETLEVADVITKPLNVDRLIHSVRSQLGVR